MFITDCDDEYNKLCALWIVWQHKGNESSMRVAWVGRLLWLQQCCCCCCCIVWFVWWYLSSMLLKFRYMWGHIFQKPLKANQKKFPECLSDRNSPGYNWLTTTLWCSGQESAVQISKTHHLLFIFHTITEAPIYFSIPIFQQKRHRCICKQLSLFFPTQCFDATPRWCQWDWQQGFWLWNKSPR